jgi:hypothetical protein
VKKVATVLKKKIQGFANIALVLNKTRAREGFISPRKE